MDLLMKEMLELFVAQLAFYLNVIIFIGFVGVIIQIFKIFKEEKK